MISIYLQTANSGLVSMLYSWTLQRRISDEAPPFDTCFVRHEQCAFDIPSAWDLTYNKAAIGVVLSGCFDYRAPNGAFTAVPGSIIFGNPRESFAVRHPSEVANRRLVLWYEKAFLEEIAAALDLDQVRFDCAGLPPGRSASAILGQMHSLIQANNAENATQLAIAALTTRDQYPAKVSISEPDRLRILNVVRHVEASFSEACTVDDLSEVCGLNRYRLMRGFREVTGQTVNQYVISTRLRAAALRLGSSSEPVTEIALGVGFNDISHFNISFRAAFGITPLQMRRTMRPSTRRTTKTIVGRQQAAFVP